MAAAMSDEEQRAGSSDRAAAGRPDSPVTAVVLVAAVYIFFLLFAQFGFLQGIRAAGHGVEAIHRVLGAMALAGIAASLAAPRTIAVFGAARVVAAGLDLCALAGAIAALLFCRGYTGMAWLIVVATLTGSGLGLATVALAADLRRLTGARNVGWHVGLGTGLAYFACNLPVLFPASPAAKAWVSGGVAAVGVLVAWLARNRPAAEPADAGNPAPFFVRWLTPTGIAAATAAFLALVWFDSAAFTAVQNTDTLRAQLWSGDISLWRNGLVHAFAALAAGAALDRRWFAALLTGALALLIVGALLFGRDGVAGTLAASLYVAGVSIYSTALAAFAALAPAIPGRPAPAWRAAWLYGIAGWFGSAAGVGLAEQTGRLPAWAAPAAVVALGAAMATARLRISEKGTEAARA
jgi:hypothetical protein